MLFYDYDSRGSTTAIIAPDGTLVKAYTYDEFGNTQETTQTSFNNEVTFTGSVSDTSTGLQYMNARYYNPSTGRFLSQDTYSGNPYDPWTQHLYSYCGNNTVNMIDPTGHDPFSDIINAIVDLWESIFGSGDDDAEPVNTADPGTTTNSGKKDTTPDYDMDYTIDAADAIETTIEVAMTALDIKDILNDVDVSRLNDFLNLKKARELVKGGMTPHNAAYSMYLAPVGVSIGPTANKDKASAAKRYRSNLELVLTAYGTNYDYSDSEQIKKDIAGLKKVYTTYGGLGGGSAVGEFDYDSHRMSAQDALDAGFSIMDLVIPSPVTGYYDALEILNNNSIRNDVDFAFIGGYEGR